jgi:hypothetical protein
VLAVPRFELRIAADVDEVDLDPELVLHAAHYLERPCAQMAVRGVEKGDAGYG